MLGFLRKEYEIAAPVSGRVLSLSEVPDEIFAQKLAGDGVAIEGTGDVIMSPVDGQLTLMFKTYHAFALTLDNGIELLFHIGIDTANLKGEGFELLKKQGDRVKKGEAIIKINREFIEGKGYSLITPVLITNPDVADDIKYNVGCNVNAGQDKIFTYKIK